MRDLASSLIAEELRLGGEGGTRGAAALRVCQKLRGPLSTYAGAAGFRSLLSRALSLANAKEPWLDGFQIDPDGSIQCSPEVETQMASERAARGGGLLVAQLLELLVTFIGEALTLRLVQDVWPRAATKESKPGGKQK
jgi:hypothetical protein